MLTITLVRGKQRRQTFSFSLNSNREFSD